MGTLLQITMKQKQFYIDKLHEEGEIHHWTLTELRKNMNNFERRLPMEKKAIDLAKQIIELDLQRDAIFEQLLALLGDRAYEILRHMQNKY